MDHLDPTAGFCDLLGTPYVPVQKYHLLSLFTLIMGFLLCICNNVFSYHSSILFRAHALWALSKSKRNKAVIRRAGGLPLIAKLVKVRHTSILIPVIGTLQECASEKAYCLAIMQSEGMIADLVRNLGTESPKLKMLCASAMYVLITCFHEF